MKFVDFSVNNYAEVREIFYTKTYGTSALNVVYLILQCFFSSILFNSIMFISSFYIVLFKFKIIRIIGIFKSYVNLFVLLFH